MEPARSTDQVVLRWVSGVAGSLLLGLCGAALRVGWEWNRELVEVRAAARDLKDRVGVIEENMRTNRMVKMAPETRSELDGVRRELDGIKRELDAAWSRIQAVEARNGRRP